MDGDIIHVLTLEEVCTNVMDSRLSSGFDQMQKDMLFNINEKKIRDWTGLCANPEAVKTMNFAIDKGNNLFLSTTSELHVV